MTAVTLIEVQADLVALLTARGILTAAGEFDATKLDSIDEVLALVGAVEAVLVKHGAVLPPKVDALLRVLPLLGPLVGALSK
jgi:hypothetical protein